MHNNKKFWWLFICLTIFNYYNTTITQNFSLSHSTFFMIGKSLIKVGAFTYVSSPMQIKEFGEGASLTIGKFSSIADNVVIFLGGNHRIDWITTYPFGHINTETFNGQDITGHPTTNGAVTIGNDVWIGYNVTIMSGISIGNGAVIATGSVVTHNVEPYSIVGGNPAKHIRYRFNQDICQALETLQWWDLNEEDIKSIMHELCSSPDIEKLKIWIEKYRKDSL